MDEDLGEDSKEGVSWKFYEEGASMLGKVSKHSVPVVSLGAALSPQPTSLEQQSVSNRTDTGELSNERSPPKEQDAAED